MIEPDAPMPKALLKASVTGSAGLASIVATFFAVEIVLVAAAGCCFLGAGCAGGLTGALAFAFIFGSTIVGRCGVDTAASAAKKGLFGGAVSAGGWGSLGREDVAVALVGEADDGSEMLELPPGNVFTTLPSLILNPSAPMPVTPFNKLFEARLKNPFNDRVFNALAGVRVA